MLDNGNTFLFFFIINALALFLQHLRCAQKKAHATLQAKPGQLLSCAAHDTGAASVPLQLLAARTAGAASAGETRQSHYNFAAGTQTQKRKAQYK
jgi:hypothetical protein